MRQMNNKTKLITLLSCMLINCVCKLKSSFHSGDEKFMKMIGRVLCGITIIDPANVTSFVAFNNKMEILFVMLLIINYCYPLSSCCGNDVETKDVMMLR